MVCHLPSVFHSTSGKLDIRYRSANGLLSITVCNGGRIARFLEPTGRRSFRKDASVDISCPSTMKISLTAVKDGGDDRGFVDIHDIKVFEDPLASTEAMEATLTRLTRKTTIAITKSFGSTSLTSAYSYNTTSSQQTSTSPTTNDALTLISQSSSITSSYYSTSTVKETTSRVKPTGQQLQTTVNAEFPNTEKQQSGASPAIISVIVVVILVLFIVAAIILFVHRRRRKAQQERHSDYRGKQPGANVYSNATFSANDVDTDQPDVIRDLDFRNGLGPPDPSSLADHGGSNLQEDGYIGYGAENPSAVERGELQQLDRPTQHDRNCVSGEPEYSVLEDPRDKDSQQCSKEPRVAEEQAYDHLNRETDNSNGHQEQRHDNTYGGAAFLSDIDHYDTLVRSCEAEFNQRKRQDITTPPRNTRTKGAQDFENEYHTLSPVDEKKSKLLDNIDENTYNVLGETVDNLHRDGISPKTSESDNTTRDDYHILHSGKELGDYHEYQCPDQPLLSGSTAKAVSQAKENEGRHHDYFLGSGARGTNAQQWAESSSIYAEEHTYDHLNRDLCDVTMVDEPGKGQIKEMSKGKREHRDDYYSGVNVQGQVEQHEPLYSNDVYSELA